MANKEEDKRSRVRTDIHQAWIAESEHKEFLEINKKCMEKKNVTV